MTGQSIESGAVWGSYSQFRSNLRNEDSRVFDQLNDIGGGFDENDVFPDELFLIKDLWKMGRYHKRPLDGTDY